ncbi:unnamed protein product [Lota lota]
MCQGDKTDAENGTDVSVTPTQVVTRAANTQGIRASGGLTDAPTPANIPTKNSNVADRADRVTNPPVMTTPVAPETKAPETKAPETKAPFQLVVPVVICEEKVINEVRVKAAVSTSTCEETKAILEEAPITLCAAKVCHLQVSQDGNEILVASPDVTSSNIEAALLSEGIKKRLGVSAVEHSSTSSGVSVLVGVLVTGLLLAAGLIGGYCFKNRRTAGDKGSRLAEVGLGCPVDGENQGNTLVSVASLIPPPEIQEPTETTKIPETAEIQEKPSVNGETPEERIELNGGQNVPVPTADWNNKIKQLVFEKQGLTKGSRGMGELALKLCSVRRC